MTDLADFKVDLETARPNPLNNTQVIRGDSPRTAFTKHNDMIDALHQVVRHIGPAAPSPTSPWMLWLDTSMDPPVARQRNQANTAWDLATGVTVLSDGSIGIGTSTPSARLHVDAPIGGISTALKLTNSLTNATQGRGTDILFTGTGGSTLARIRASTSTTNNTDGALQLSANGTTGFMSFATNGVDRVRIDAAGNLLLVGVGALGYGTGSGGTVVQLTDKTTAVTLNKASGRITTHAAALAGGSVATFTLNNTAISGDDCVVVTVKAGNATPGSYQVWTEGALNGSCKVCLRNATAGSLSEAVSLSFVVIRGATA